MPELLQGLGKWNASLDKDPLKRPFANLKRGPDGKFDDGELVNILSDSIEDVAGCPGANNVPTALRAAEILGMQQARHWNCASLNEFRKFFGLKAHETFEDINSDPNVSESLRHLYEHPDYVELYPGIVAEDHKMPMVPGVVSNHFLALSHPLLSGIVRVLIRLLGYLPNLHRFESYLVRCSHSGSQ